MATSETDIANSALIKLGAERIISLDDGNNRARVMKQQFPLVRDAFLACHPWNFCISYVELAAISPLTPDIIDYTYVFQLPADCLRVIKTSLSSDEDWEEIAGRRIACYSSELTVKYIAKITDVTKYSAPAVDALAYALAEDTCFALTQNLSLKADMERWGRLKMREARSYDAQVGSTVRVEADEWLTARRY